ncbi:MAG TPA: type II toxin-antitoxin system prevent-host-death family antitoxin [Gammaproteobacteria bacterium]|nr:type II toxin-antitoxin system prevent-host-death family antitoxin [Gammaproteobacteria bacterium]
MQVSVHELKNHLSQYLHQVKAGEFIIVTSHNKPLAKLIPYPQFAEEEANLMAQIEGITWNGKKPRGGGKKRPKIIGKTVAEYVIEDRR